MQPINSSSVYLCLPLAQSASVHPPWLCKGEKSLQSRLSLLSCYNAFYRFEMENCPLQLLSSAATVLCSCCPLFPQVLLPQKLLMLFVLSACYIHGKTHWFYQFVSPTTCYNHLLQPLIIKIN